MGKCEKAKGVFCVVLWCLAQPLAAQTPAAISIDEEPHHHLIFQNDYVKVHRIELPPRDAYKLHRHDLDEISIVISGGTSVAETVGSPNVLRVSKPGDVNFAPSPRVHLNRNIGETMIVNVAVTLLRPQGKVRNLRSNQIQGQPQNCPPAASTDSNAPYVQQPLFETDQTRATLTRIRPQQRAPLSDPERDELVVAIEDAAVGPASGKGPEKLLHAGDFLWVGRQDAPRVWKNVRDVEARFVTISFEPR